MKIEYVKQWKNQIIVSWILCQFGGYFTLYILQKKIYLRYEKLFLY